jgi:hypothetical protein
VPRAEDGESGEVDGGGEQCEVGGEQCEVGGELDLTTDTGEAAVVRHARVWPRALAISRPTPADVQVLTRLATEQERLPTERIEVRMEDGSRPADEPTESADASHDTEGR